MNTIVMKVEGMSCSHCQSRVKKALESVAGVSAADVDLAKKEATIQLTQDVDAAVLKQSVEKIGFKVVE